MVTQRTSVVSRFVEWRAIVPWLAALAIGVLPAAEVFADNGRDFAGIYQVQVVGPTSNPTTTINLTIRLQNVSGIAVKNAVVELDGLPPAPLAQSFPASVSIADRSVATVTGSFLVRGLDAQRWQKGAGLPPTVVVIGTDKTGRTVRRMVELNQVPGVMR